MSISMWILVGILFVGIVIYAIISVNIGEKKGQNSDAKNEICELVKEATGQSESIGLYGYFKEQHSEHGFSYSSTSIHMEYYIVGFQPGNMSLYLSSIDFSDGHVIASDFVEYTKENLGRVTKFGTYFCLYDKNDEKIFEVYVDPLNTKMGMECPVNVTQREECAQFKEFLKEFANDINDANDVPLKLRKWGK